MKEAIDTYQLGHDKSIGTARKMDVVFIIAEIYFKQKNLKMVKE